MGGAIDKLWFCGIGLFEAREFIGALTVDAEAVGIPPSVSRESAVKHVETAPRGMSQSDCRGQSKMVGEICTAFNLHTREVREGWCIGQLIRYRDHSAVGFAVTLMQTRSQRPRRTMTKA
jgi:hypothetical protein